MSASYDPRVYIVLVNWNGWRDTLECLESLLRLDYPAFHIIVCDNSSTDGSVEKIRAWADGSLSPPEPSNPALAHLTRPGIRKPVACQFVEISSSGQEINLADQITIVQTRKNVGFAGGNNTVLRFLLRSKDWDYVWLLNNDTVVPPQSLSELVRRMAERPGAGICGSTLLFYDRPTTIQACGGAVYKKWVGRVGHVGEAVRLDQALDETAVESRLDYVVGASMFVSRAFVEDIGLMEEDYFLYFEEIDWACRSRSRYSLAYSRESIVYHKEGASAGTARQARNQSAIAEYYSTRNRLKFTARFFPYALPTVCFAVFASALERAVHRRWQNLKMICRALAMQEPDFFQ